MGSVLALCARRGRWPVRARGGAEPGCPVAPRLGTPGSPKRAAHAKPLAISAATLNLRPLTLESFDEPRNGL